MRAINMKTAQMINPLGIDISKPLLTWTCEGGICQTAYQIIATIDGMEVWNSGKVFSSSMKAAYKGQAESRARVEWSIRLWDENDAEGEKNYAWFEYALLDRADFKASWINPEIEKFDKKKNQPASILVRDFELGNTKRARIYATARGLYSLRINGRRVTENVLTPGTSEYWFRHPYQTFDVSDYLCVGKNRIEVTLGDGWWRGCNGNTGTRNVFGSDIAFWLQLEVNKEVRLITDNAWLASQGGPIRFNDLQLGERVDARMEASEWHQVKLENFGYENLICANTLPLKEKENFSAKVIHTPSGKTVLDFGQNMAGYVSFKLMAKNGQTIKMTHGEYIGDDGEFSDSNLQTVGRKNGELHQVVEFTCKDGLNEYTPTLCIFGFQYVLVETEIVIDGSEFTAHAVYSDMTETASFICNLQLVNQLFHNAVWSEKSNFVDIPTDCPQRERSGWTGDAGLFCRTGLTLMNSYPVYARWLAECRADQYSDGRVANFAPRRSTKPSFLDSLYDGSCAWGDASVIVPYEMFCLYGDTSILEENWDFMCRWMDYCEKKAKRSRLKNRFKRGEYKNYIIDTGIHWGEWLEAGVSMADATKDMIFHGVPDIATAYFAQSCRMMSEIATILGKSEEAKRYVRLYKKVNAAYHHIELPDGAIHSDRQCRYVRPLQMGLLTEQESKNAAAALNELVANNGYHLNTGFLTTAHLCRVLADNGFVETAYKLLLQEETPGWLYQVKNGATTIWESWEGNTGASGVASLNHYSKGAVVSWLIEGICGIRIKNGVVTIQPQPYPLMQYAQASFDAPCGRIVSGWKYVEGKVEYTVILPANVTATFIMPDGTAQALLSGEHHIKTNERLK